MTLATILAVGVSGGLWLGTALRALHRRAESRELRVAYIDSRRSRA